MAGFPLAAGASGAVGVSDAGAAPSSCLSSERNSSRVNNERRTSTSAGFRSRPSSDTGSGMSVRMVASLRASSSVVSPARRFSPTLPLTLAASATSASSVAYCPSHLAAVLGPTLSMPGMLSELSPTKAR
jgi:hypothetical protein